MTTIPPSFFIVGAPKCGTTALCDFLGQHPDIFIPKIKEPNFFGSDLTGAKFTTDLNEYLRLFKSHDKKISGEGSTWYLYSRCAAREIFDYNSMSKIILMIREPVDLLHSLHNQLVYDGINENVRDFYTAINLESERSKGKSIPTSCIRKEALLYSTIPKFKEQLLRYLWYFDRSCIHVVLYDDFCKNPLNEYRKVVEFLEQDTDFVPVIKNVNGSKYTKFPFLNRLKTNARFKKSIKSILPAKVFQTVKKQVYSFNTNYSSRPELDKEFARNIQALFHEDIQFLSDYLNRDFSGWLKKYECENSELLYRRGS